LLLTFTPAGRSSSPGDTEVARLERTETGVTRKERMEIGLGLIVIGISALALIFVTGR
jgi:hypothetical protein